MRGYPFLPYRRVRVENHAIPTGPECSDAIVLEALCRMEVENKEKLPCDKVTTGAEDGWGTHLFQTQWSCRPHASTTQIPGKKKIFLEQPRAQYMGMEVQPRKLLLEPAGRVKRHLKVTAVGGVSLGFRGVYLCIAMSKLSSDS